MEILMWTVLVGGLVVVTRRMLPEMLAGLIDRIAQMRETGHDKATPVPAHTVRRLSRRRRHRHGRAIY